MTSVTVQASRTYEVKIGRGLLAQTGETLRALGETPYRIGVCEQGEKGVELKW